MTQEDKQLLLKDLCVRLPYGVFIHYHWSREGNTIDEDRELDFSDVETLKYNIENPQNGWCEISWKPYLRPMSSMTDEERAKIAVLSKFNGLTKSVDFAECSSIVVDYCNSRHLDYRGLVPMGLALEAPEDMYKTE